MHFVLKNFTSDNLIKKFYEDFNFKIKKLNEIEKSNGNEKFILMKEIFDYILINYWILEIDKFNNLRLIIYKKLKKFEVIMNKKYNSEKDSFDPSKYLNYPTFDDIVFINKIEKIEIE